MGHTGIRRTEVLFWRSPLVAYATTLCAITKFLQSSVQYHLSFKFFEENEHMPYSIAVEYKAIALLPWDHALMTFYELYSTCTPMLLPRAEWMYRLLFQRGQLAVGEQIYKSTKPG